MARLGVSPGPARTAALAVSLMSALPLPPGRAPNTLGWEIVAIKGEMTLPSRMAYITPSVSPPNRRMITVRTPMNRA